MLLTPGTRLGPYEILAPIGAGGMGEVYRARDTRLGREVAVKVLPAEYSKDADRLRRFEQEARAASALNHPNILVIHDIGTQDDMPYIVSELLEGENLRAKLRGEPLLLRKALDYAIGAAHGLAAAHQRGITHRDLKPENIFITEDSRVKILDFGIAKLTQPLGECESNAPTQTYTVAGTLLGTVAYMSSEQASGQAVDFRSDQFSFGAILYEMATGRQAFARRTAAETLTAIIREEPEPAASLNPRIPTALRWVIDYCLAKDPGERYGSTKDLARDLERVKSNLSELGSAKGEGIAAPSRSKTRSRALLIVSGAVGLAAAAAAVGVWWDRSRTPPAPELRYLTYSGHDSSPAASPDGKTIAFSSDRDGRRRIWLKELSSGNEVALTSGGPDDFPRFHPDGSMILFSRGGPAHGSLYRVPILGGEPRKLVDDVYLGGDWSPDGRQIVFVRQTGDSQAIVVLGADGTGEHRIALTQRVVPGANGFIHPRWSPDGRTIASANNLGMGGMPYSIFLVAADGKQPRTISSPPGGFAISSLAWSNSDEVVYSQTESVSPNLGVPGGGTARVIRQDTKSGAFEILFRSPHNSNVVDIVSPGRIVFDARSSRESLRELSLGEKAIPPQYRWLTQGNSQDRQPVYSPDGQWVLFTSNRSGNLDLWEISPKSGTLRRITDDPAHDLDPAFTPDGKKILWSSNRSGPFEIWIANADGSGVRQVTHDGADAENPTMTRDGSWIVYASGNPTKQGLWKIHADGSEATRLVQGPTTIPEVSPDGQYAMFNALEGERAVRIGDGRVLPWAYGGVGSQRPRWPSGRAIALVGQDEKGVWGVFVQDFDPNRDTRKTLRPLAGFETEMITESYGISPDGSRLVIASQEPLISLMLAERVSGIAPQVRTSR